MRLRFTIRDLLWLAVVVALAFFWLQSRALNRQLDLDNAEINELSADREKYVKQNIEFENRHEADLKEIERLRAMLPTTPELK
jgi:hypothetical protein